MMSVSNIKRVQMCRAVKPVEPSLLNVTVDDSWASGLETCDRLHHKVPGGVSLSRMEFSNTAGTDSDK